MQASWDIRVVFCNIDLLLQLYLSLSRLSVLFLKFLKLLDLIDPELMPLLMILARQLGEAPGYTPKVWNSRSLDLEI